jgi:hypothetical protein
MSIMDIFRGFQGGEGKTGMRTQNDPTLPANPSIVGSGNQTVPGEGSNPKTSGNIPAFPAPGEGQKSPMENFSKLWDKADTDPKPVEWATKLTPDTQAVLNAANQANFSASIPKEVLAEAMKGNAEAFAAAINHTAQQAFAQSALSTAETVNIALERQANHFRDKVIPDILRRQDVSRVTNAELPSNPAVDPVVRMVRDQIASKNPNASAEEVAKLTNQYMGDLTNYYASGKGKQITDIPKTPANQGGTDWGKFFDSN